MLRIPTLTGDRRSNPLRPNDWLNTLLETTLHSRKIGLWVERSQ
jgi:hypothetical protein